MSESNNWPAPNPAQAGQSSPSFQGAVLGREPLATFWQRLLGRILDSLNVFVLYLGYVMLVAIVLAATNVSDGDPIVAWLANGGIIAFVALQVYWEGKGGSFFRRGYGAVIVDASTGRPIGTARALLRIVVANFSLLAFGIGFLWMLWDPNNQTWHDKAARSLVVKR
jgi:uncharacterized RDD family membrane protein YckC